MSEYLRFHLRGTSESGKTNRWAVTGRSGEAWLGEVRWYAPWRRYCLYTAPDTVWSAGCMEQAAEFCHRRTEEHRGVRRKRQQQREGGG